MSGYSDAFHEQIEDQIHRRQRLFYKIEGDLLFSPAFNEIASSGATVAVLLQVIARETLPPSLKRRKQLEKAGLWPPKKAKPFSFPLKEASDQTGRKRYGFSERALADGLRRLHEVGFITRTSAGSATKRGDFAVYERSDRWRKWGKPDFEEIPWPKAENKNEEGKPIWFRDRGKFTRTRLTKKELAARFTATKEDSTATVTATPGNVAAKVAVNRACDDPKLAATSTVFLRSPCTPGVSDLLPILKKRNLKDLEVNVSKKHRIQKYNPKPPVDGWVEEYEGLVP